MSKLSKPTVSPLPPGAVIVTEHKEPHAAQIRSVAQMVEPIHGTVTLSQQLAQLAAQELRAAADYVERLKKEHKQADAGWQKAEGDLAVAEAKLYKAEQEAQTLRETIEQSRRTSRYWKDEHAAANAYIETLREELDRLKAALAAVEARGTTSKICLDCGHATDHTIHCRRKHRCGLQGFNPMMGDTCPGCDFEHQQRTGKK